MTSKILVGDVLVMLGTLEDASVDCVVTSPPYWGLRDYQTASWNGGDEECEHTVSHYSDNLKPHVDRPFRGDRSLCLKCGAVRVDNQIGLEPTLAEFVATMVKVFGEVARVLKPSGTVWLNLGDSYTSGGRKSYNPGASALHPAQQKGMARPEVPNGLKPKDLCGAPWRVAFGLQDDGWYLRQEIIWHKPNPMPESVRDRCTKAHESIFLLAHPDSGGKYYYDADAVRERQGNEMTAEEYRSRLGSSFGGSIKTRFGIDKKDGGRSHPLGRNKRSVWTITTKPYSQAHFATFPPELPRTCILAGCPEGGTVLDPFAGAGTTLLVANQLQRHAIGIELNPEYAAMAEDRIYSEAPLLNQVALG